MNRCTSGISSSWILFFWIHCFTITATSYYDGMVERIVDGDTIWVQMNDPSTGSPPEKFTKENRLKIRMIGMDAPEWHLPVAGLGVVGQGNFGKMSYSELLSLLKVGDSILVEYFGLDIYQRVLARVWLNSIDINGQMIKRGWAIPYILCGGTGPCSRKALNDQKVTTYLRYCANARNQELGMFNSTHLLTEMPFEFRLRMTGRSPDKWVGNFYSKKFYSPSDYSKVPLCSRVFFKTEADAKRAGFLKQ